MNTKVRPCATLLGFCAGGLLIGLSSLIGLSAEPNQPTPRDIAFFQEKIQPILESRCLKCHGQGPKIRGNLRLTSRDNILRGGDLGAAVSLDDPDDSWLLQAINYDGMEMPPDAKLPDAERKLLTRWVRGGIVGMPQVDDSTPHVEEERISLEDIDHWAYLPFDRPELPSVEATSWIGTPIDAFILRSLEDNHLAPAPQASRRSLVRRAYFDLTGLPPTPDEVSAFLADDSTDAYEQLIERLLASPHYGVKWGRHWLDLVRFAETNGYERDGVKSSAWRYRDYVIDAFNDNKPYDQFVLEQLAGDELREATPETITATGYYRLGLWDDEPVDADQAFYDSMDDVISTTSQVFMAMTIGCARCHDHKLDPILQKDYYSLLAFVHNTLRDIKQLEFEKTAFTLNTQRVIASEQQQRLHDEQLAAHNQQREELERAVAGYETRIYETLAPAEKEDAQDKKTREHLIAKRREQVLSDDDLETYLQRKSKLEQLLDSKITPLPRALVIQENGPRAPDTFVLVRGSCHALGDRVEPRFPRVLHLNEPKIAVPAESDSSCGRRLAMARTIVDPKNPLTARVMVNRIWQHHFGRGIVRTSSDFGMAGDAPTHPRLLDWLAAEFIARDWNIKDMHRLIMRSSTYRMSSRDSTEALVKDPRNDLFWRFDMRRLTAEEVRDSTLAVSGSLSLELRGPSVFTKIPAEVLAGASRPEVAWGRSPPDQRGRRSIFVLVKRSLAEPVLKTFDSPDTESSCAVRFVTTVPTQSLTMLNGEFFNREAALFARRLRREAGPNLRLQVPEAFRLALCREPTRNELRTAFGLIEAWQREDGVSQEDAMKFFCLTIFNLNEFSFLD